MLTGKTLKRKQYIGVLTIILAWTLLFQSTNLLAYAIIVATCFHLFIILYEEPHLQRKFGNEYLTYKTKVGRWLSRFPRKPAS